MERRPLFRLSITRCRPRSRSSSCEPPVGDSPRWTNLPTAEGSGSRLQGLGVAGTRHPGGRPVTRHIPGVRVTSFCGVSPREPIGMRAHEGYPPIGPTLCWRRVQKVKAAASCGGLAHLEQLYKIMRRIARPAVPLSALSPLHIDPANVYTEDVAWLRRPPPGGTGIRGGHRFGDLCRPGTRTGDGT